MTNGDLEAKHNASGAGVRLAHMEWTQEGEQIFTLMADDYRCKVWWVDRGDIWAAMVSQGGMATASYNFTNRTEAQAWCVQQVAHP